MTEAVGLKAEDFSIKAFGIRAEELVADFPLYWWEKVGLHILSEFQSAFLNRIYNIIHKL